MNKPSSYIFALLIVVMLGILWVPALSSQANALEFSTVLKPQTQTSRIDDQKVRAHNEVNRRITILNQLIQRIQDMQIVSDSQKNQLVQQVNIEIGNLNMLGTKLTSDTDSGTIEQDKKGVVTSYSIFALFIPKINIIALADKIVFTSNVLKDHGDKIQIRITMAKAKGINVDSIQAMEGEYMAKLQHAAEQVQQAVNIVNTLTPSGYPANKSSLFSARDLLTVARKDLHDATVIDGRMIAELVRLEQQ